MNIGNILKVADAIEASTLAKRPRAPVGFNMARYGSTDGFTDHTGHECGTVACIAGWTCVLDGWSVNCIVSTENDAFEHARRRFGIGEGDALELFIPENYEDDEITPHVAVRCLRNLAITGKVDWEAAMKPADPVMPALPASVAHKQTA